MDEDLRVKRFVEACDRAIIEAEKLREAYSRKNDSRAALAQRALDFIEERKHGALEGTLPLPATGAAIGFSRFIGDVEWGSEGKALLAAVYAAERYWWGYK